MKKVCNLAQQAVMVLAISLLLFVVYGLHYAPGFNHFLAQRVAGYINRLALVPNSYAASQASGKPFSKNE